MTDETTAPESAEYGSAREALAAAFSATSAEEIEPAAEPIDAPVETTETTETTEPVEDTGPLRDEQGRFARREPVDPDPTPAPAPPAPVDAAPDAPAGFDAGAKAAWANADPALKGAFTRRIGELENGYNQLRAQWEPVRQYHEMAQQNGMTIADCMAEYSNLYQMLQSNPLQMLDTICQKRGFSLRDVAAHVMGQPAPEKDAQVQQMQAQMREMQGRLSQYEAAERRQREEAQTKAVQSVTEFAAQNARFEELSPIIRGLLQSGMAADLPAAYAMADRLNPAPIAAAQTRTTTQPAAQTRAAPKSVSGAPSSGSNPDDRTVPASARDALRMAAAQVGLRS